MPVTSRDHVLGSGDAAVTIVEYGDYQCPHCAAAQPVLAQLMTRHRGRVRLVYRHFPLAEVHPCAEPAAEAAEFAGDHNAFWSMHQTIFGNQPRLSVPLLIALAANHDLSPIALRDVLANGTYDDKIRQDFLGGVRSGVNGTPAFFVNGVRHDSPYGAAALPSAVDAAILAASVA
jgi:protein-disulfide isomerase